MTFDLTMGYFAHANNTGRKVIAALCRSNPSTKYVVYLDGKANLITREIYIYLKSEGYTNLEIVHTTGTFCGKKSLPIMKSVMKDGVSRTVIKRVPVKIYMEKISGIPGAHYIQIQATLDTPSDIAEYDIGIQNLVSLKCDGKLPDTGCVWSESISRSI